MNARPFALSQREACARRVLYVYLIRKSINPISMQRRAPRVYVDQHLVIYFANHVRRDIPRATPAGAPSERFQEAKRFESRGKSVGVSIYLAEKRRTGIE